MIFIYTHTCVCVGREREWKMYMISWWFKWLFIGEIQVEPEALSMWM